MSLSSDPIKTLAAYRSDHRIVDVGGHCETDGIPVYRIKGGTMRHEEYEISKLVNAAARANLEMRPGLASAGCESGGRNGCTCEACW